MKRIALLSIASAIAGSLAAQSNTVPGLDGRLTAVDDLTYYGRRGAAYPNGEVGMAMLNEMCNPGSVVIPWMAAMQPNHPKFGFLIVRRSGDRMEQISDRSMCKHAFTSTNYSGSCGSCQNPGTGTVMGINCADTYGAGNNADRTWLGPADEIDPWLGTWNPVGSYFDVGDPQTGLGPADGVRSLITSGFDSVKNRVTVQESDLLTAGAAYFYGIHLVHQGESGANRGDNLASRGFNPSHSGSTWSFSNNSVGQVYGSILQHWTGAQLDVGQNGTDDGRFFVAVKVTALGGGMHHYEYAVHNADNSRGGATFRVPVDPAATVTNFTFRDIDTDPLNDWVGSKSGNEIVFMAPANNPHNWNTIYNFGFDCSIAPSSGTAKIDEARMGPGALWVSIPTKVPSGIPTADVTYTGQGCGSCQRSFYEQGAFDLANQAVGLTLQSNVYTVGVGTVPYVAPTGSTLSLTDDSQVSVALPFTLNYPGGSTNTLWVCSNGFVSAASNGTSYTPSSSEFLNGATRWAGCWRDLNPGAGGQVRFDSSASAVRITFVSVPNYSGGGLNTFQYTFESNGNVTFRYLTMSANSALVGFTPGGGAIDPGSMDISAALAATFTLCAIDSLGLAMTATAPVLGSTVTFTTTNIPVGSFLGLQILSLTPITPGLSLAFLDMPGCELYQSLDVLQQFATPGSVGSSTFSVPNNNGLIGTTLASQSATLTVGFNPFGFLTSNGARLTLGL
ncbi:MAG TPA: hypothetical protein VFZ65_19895 [Planctomycetota bacterium]|nr:hypothetical protein [Planctomycetota bacterium]